MGPENASENGCKDRKIQDCFRFSIQKHFRLATLCYRIWGYSFSGKFSKAFQARNQNETNDYAVLKTESLQRGRKSCALNVNDRKALQGRDHVLA